MGEVNFLASNVTTHSLACISSIGTGQSMFQFPKVSPLPQKPNICFRWCQQGNSARNTIQLSPGKADFGDFGV